MVIKVMMLMPQNLTSSMFSTLNSFKRERKNLYKNIMNLVHKL